MKYSKEQLIEMVKPYFEKEEVTSLFVTEDNQVFYSNRKVDAASHARVYKLRPPFEITRADLSEKPVNEEAAEDEKDEKDVLIKMAKEMGIENVNKRMSVTTLEKLIKDKEDAGE